MDGSRRCSCGVHIRRRSSPRGRQCCGARRCLHRRRRSRDHDRALLRGSARPGLHGRIVQPGWEAGGQHGQGRDAAALGCLPQRARADRGGACRPAASAHRRPARQTPPPAAQDLFGAQMPVSLRPGQTLRRRIEGHPHPDRPENAFVRKSQAHRKKKSSAPQSLPFRDRASSCHPLDAGKRFCGLTRRKPSEPGNLGLKADVTQT